MEARLQGHTLVELLAVVGLVAVLAGLSVPAFRELAANLRRDERIRELRNTLLLARAEALARGVPVVVCPGALACTANAPWSAGWLAYADSAPPRAQRSRGEPLLARVSAHDGVTVRANREAIEFQPTAVAATTATFEFCDWRGARAARALVVSRTGRVRTTDRDAAGARLACP